MVRRQARKILDVIVAPTSRAPGRAHDKAIAWQLYGEGGGPANTGRLAGEYTNDIEECDEELLPQVHMCAHGH